ncbi:MAG: GntR family transcriptional regulator [Mixta calida]|uniref:GntR family transcriptional regulator n=1 Tax=Mixta calida TaxID=665913 RepID=A0ABM6S2N4_9GAMM|nr:MULTISPECIES: GntR family transcriptional regulator [Mixta]AIX73183.1 GntR family transcriptional regulator [Pantoea sp. PSNIH2]MBS6057082.1 GntR family transcriptional regulator [Pantoea sp.]POU42831.1 GntR family transcriptional regulator [Pantoea sp. PSNIH5]POU60415.1 GntR family transcriptional regulator [Pantoea sp. PSNIH4]POY65929.1 GntR family transcriptional regulator [Pantoea sp. PSNIH3]HCW46978.1 GntR family transcriptional regulator [Erwiniaceae bacterium]
MSIPYTITTSEPVNQQIYRFLRREIVTCIIPPGSLLSEKEVSCRFNVSRQPVREAFIKLAEAGLVQILPQRGTFVRKISAQRVADGRFIREAVEIAVVRRAAMEATPAALMALEHNLQLQKMAAQRHDAQAFLQLDDEFHRLIAQSINCELAWETVENIKATMDRVRFLTLSKVSPPESLIDQHEEILHTLRNHDPDGAEKAMRHHLQEMIFSITPIAEQNSEWFEQV